MQTLIAVAGVIVTIMVVAGMMLMTPGNVEVATRPEPTPPPDPQASERPA